LALETKQAKAVRRKNVYMFTINAKEMNTLKCARCRFILVNRRQARCAAKETQGALQIARRENAGMRPQRNAVRRDVLSD
jgi:hypothetical protein